MHKDFQNTFKSAFVVDPNTNKQSYQRNRAGSLRTAGLQLENAMNTAITSLKVSTQQEAERLKNERTQSLIDATNRNSFDEDQKSNKSYC